MNGDRGEGPPGTGSLDSEPALSRSGRISAPTSIVTGRHARHAQHEVPFVGRFSQPMRGSWWPLGLIRGRSRRARSSRWSAMKMRCDRCQRTPTERVVNEDENQTLTALITGASDYRVRVCEPPRSRAAGSSRRAGRAAGGATPVGHGDDSGLGGAEQRPKGSRGAGRGAARKGTAEAGGLAYGEGEARATRRVD